MSDRTFDPNTWFDAYRETFASVHKSQEDGFKAVERFARFQYAVAGDYLAEDPACGYQPGAHGGATIDLPASLTFGLPVDYSLGWETEARERLAAIPSFARGMVVKAVEAYARARGERVVTRELLAQVRASWGGRFRPQA